MLLKTAHETLSILQSGAYVDANQRRVHYVSSPTTDSFNQTVLYPSDSPHLAAWEHKAQRHLPDFSEETDFEFRQASPVAAALAALADDGEGVGILNAGSAKHAPTSFLSGGDDPEAVLLRSSTFDAVQRSPAAMEWYRTHRADNLGGVMSNTLMYTPNVQIIRDAYGKLIPPQPVDVVTAAPPNVNAITAHHPVDAPIVVRDVLRERCGRALRLFQLRGVKTLVLDTMGVDAETAGAVWAELLACDDSLYRSAFQHVIFAVPGRPYDKFREAFELAQFNAELTKALTS
ncbi:hypothetical protein AURDEDRAFT_116125 [Auricularia subglabra TFB-10046 SS5]|uniref:Microbial-type PARG catalytic domain-containing protein n=1 Tax=Auricularia subglabra (strain TFB-10046 / SS5) TaxID=717982 RepID=J0D1G6_AURST|nr:hypothetical protein AURDEDRAFT_116125 [Auricularia subglabra TFB-10046 SS5]